MSQKLTKVDLDNAVAREARILSEARILGGGSYGYSGFRSGFSGRRFRRRGRRIFVSVSVSVKIDRRRRRRFT